MSAVATEEATVLVVGGGPVGLATAFELAHHGVDALVVEPRREVGWQRPRAKTTSARTMEHLRRWGIAGAVRSAAFLPLEYSDQVVFCSELCGREITRFSGCFALTTDAVEEYAEAGQQIPQPLFEETLRRELADRRGIRLLLGWRVDELTEGGDGVEASLRDGEGGTRRVRAKWAVGCDGPRSVVREALGATYLGTTDLRPNLNLVFRARGLHELHRFGRAIHYWVLNPRVAGVLGPMDRSDTWWCIATGAGVLDREPARIVAELVGAPVECEVLSIDPWSARMAVASSYGSARIFLAGDAAHLNPPWGGHGFNTGVGDAVNLGWKLAALANGWGGPGLLASYEAERRPIATETIALAERNMSVLAVDLADERLGGEGGESERLRLEAARHIQATKSAEFHSLGLVLGYAYDDSPIVAREAGSANGSSPEHYVPDARPGARLPHHWLAPGHSLYDELGRGFTLVLTEPQPTGNLLEAALARHLPLRVVDLSAHHLEHLDAPALLIRPDQHVAWRGDLGAIEPGELLDLCRGGS